MIGLIVDIILSGLLFKGKTKPSVVIVITSVVVGLAAVAFVKGISA